MRLRNRRQCILAKDLLEGSLEVLASKVYGNTGVQCMVNGEELLL